MRKGQDAKCKAIASGGVGLTALALVLLNPIMPSVYANNGDSTADVSNIVPSTVNIAFSTASGSTEITPTTPEGALARFMVKASVDVNNSGGYSVYVGSLSTNLVGDRTGETIASTAERKTFNELEVNTWGYFATAGDTVPDNALYRPMAQGQGDQLYYNASSEIASESKEFLLSFAARIGSDKPADVYQNDVTLSVVSSPLEVTGLKAIATMQEMTVDICDASKLNDTKQLVDARDGNKYWVAKLADGKCWMTQNLDLNILAGGFPDDETADMSYQNSDMVAPWTSPTTATSSTIGSFSASAQTESRSWDQGKYVLNTPLSGENCNTSSVGQGLSTCQSNGWVQAGERIPSPDPDFFTKTTYVGENGGICSKAANTAVSVETSGECAQYDAHYEAGNYYQWNAATAGTGGTIVSTNANSAAGVKDAESSICPKGWQLPKSGGSSNTNSFDRDGSFDHLLRQYGWKGTANSLQSNVLASSPLFYVRSGVIHASGYIVFAGNQGRYWSSTATTLADNAYYLFFYVGTDVRPSEYYYRNTGCPVRCIAR